MAKDVDPLYCAGGMAADPICDREPICDYKTALWAVLVELIRTGREPGPADPLPFEAQLIARIFWVSDARVRADLRKFGRTI